MSNANEIFDRPLHLAGVLDNAADALARTWFGYEWNDRTRCNCGIVASQILQATPAQLKAALPPIIDDEGFRPTWRSMTEAYCRDTSLPRHEIFARLLAAGLNSSDFTHLEDLADPKILRQMEPRRRVHGSVLRSRKSDVIAYLRTWAEGIERHHDAKISKANSISAESEACSQVR
jgi:hypothetical protein